MANTDEIQIGEIIENWAKSVRSKDINGIVAHHSDDILLFDVVEPLQSKGMAAYKQSWEEVYFPWHSEDGDFTVHELDITAGDDIAFCHGIIHCSGTDTGQKVNLEIRLTIGLKKRNGEWVILHEHHSEVAK